MLDFFTTATAVKYWDKRWSDDDGRKDWLTPQPEVQHLVPLLKERGVRSILDLGCGVGRHALFLAAQGFQAFACDGSANGIDFLRQQAAQQGLTLELRCTEMIALPYASAALDYVLAWNVIYHGDERIVQRTLAEIRRVLHPGGLFQGTMLSKRNSKFGKGREIAKNTFVIEDHNDKNHPHYYCNAAELATLFSAAGFELLSLRDHPDDTPGSYHWRFVAETIFP